MKYILTKHDSVIQQLNYLEKENYWVIQYARRQNTTVIIDRTFKKLFIFYDLIMY